MAWFADNAPCTYFGERWAPHLRAIGWLARGQSFATGLDAQSDLALLKLNQLVSAPYQPIVFTGIHQCDLCDSDGPAGTSNLWIPGNGLLYVCPELIVHYIREHDYSPPDDFCDALMRCPPMSSWAYFDSYEKNGGCFLT